MLPTKLAFVDIETTGTSPVHDRIIEIGVLRVEDGKVVSTLKTLVDPGYHIPPEIINLTGITPKEIESAPTFRDIQDALQEILKGCIFIAHNVRFDYSFIKNEFKRLRVPFSQKQLCTVKLSRILYPSYSKHDLSSLIDRFGFDCLKRHRAFDDAKVLWDFYQLIQRTFPLDHLEKTLAIISKKPSLPANLDSASLKSLPDSAGVYIFYGDNGIPLYIGKSINIKERVRSHFSSDHTSVKEMKMSQQVKSIEAIKTAGELGALLLESSLIKKMQPIYNRALRYSRQLTVLLENQNKEGYKTVEINTLDNIEVEQLSRIIGIFRSAKVAKQFLIKAAKEHNLCEKLLGIELLKGGCFGYRLGRCKGACIQKEIYQKYNLRFLEAFINLRVKPWPFEGPVVINEENPLEEIKEAFIIDKWCYIGTLNSEQLIPEVSQKPYFDVDSYKQSLKASWEKMGIIFDYDAYKILNRYVKSSKNISSIRVLSSEERTVLGLG